MRDEIIDILWDFARSVSKTTLNAHLNYQSAKEKNKETAVKSANEIIAHIKNHESKLSATQNSAQMG